VRIATKGNSVSRKSSGASRGDGLKARFDKRMAILTLLVAIASGILLPLYLHFQDAQRERPVAGAEEAPSGGQSSQQPAEGCTVLTSVESSPAPQPGQAQRSSNDFSLDKFPHGMRVLRWRVVGGTGGSVSFDVLQDVRGGFDQVVYSAVRDGAETPHNNLDPLYIANPQNAQGPFTVEVSACS
jgi:hypothetical protein